MISCVICSRRLDVSAELKENIASTIGCEYELVVIDNSKNEYSIFSAYNEGVRRAKGDILCFMHEDILYHTNDWGVKIKEYFNQYSRAGLLGVAGTHYLSNIPAGWWETETTSEHYLQGKLVDNKYLTTEEYQHSLRIENNPTQVCAVDGLWLCMPRTVFQIVSWDEINLSGFHGYDMDMSLQVWNVGFEVHMFWDVLIEHKSLGNVSESFYRTYEKIWNKWKHLLPMQRGIELSIEEQNIRNTLVSLKMENRLKDIRINNIYNSCAYKLGFSLLKPIKFFKRIITNKEI